MALDDLRRQIDDIDSEIVRLLGERFRVVAQVREEKAQSDAPIYDPAREAMLLRRICEMRADPLPISALRAIYQEILSASRAFQALKVAYLGPPLTNTYLAALKQFGTSAYLVPCRTVEDIFDVTERGEAHVGIVPIENSVNGIVAETCDCLVETPLRICLETYIPIHHALLSKCRLEDVKIVFSHPQVFAQSREWLRDNLPSVEQIASSSTAAAARQASREEYAAAIAPSISAEPYALNILAENIEDRPDNRTRFFVVGQSDSSPSGRDKTSIVFAASHRPGSLHDALSPLHRHGINMTLIQSRPAHAQLWEYVFFVDFLGHVTDPEIAGALDDLRQRCLNLKVLGSYPAAE
jgi:chorismate mutase/prephenate dehydratase